MDSLSPISRSRNMSRIKSKNTKPEMKVRKYLFSLGYRYRIHYPIYGRPDVVFLNKKIALFIHGCFWHGHKNCKEAHFPKSNINFWSTKINNNIERDNENLIKLRKDKWTVLVIWECELEKELHKTLQKLNKRLSLINPS